LFISEQSFSIGQMDPFDIAVLGTGPAGKAAAEEAARHGATSVLLDEAEVWGLGGGPLLAPGDPPGPFRIDLIRAARTEAIAARALIVCAGAHEVVIPFAGWTLPGVVGLSEATKLLKDAILPGRRVVVAGSGARVRAVVAGIEQLGGTLAETVPLHSGWRIAAALGEGAVAEVELVPLGGGESRRVACDAVCVGHGFVPATEATRLFRAAHAFKPARGGWVPRLDAWQRTSVARLYAAGDCAGLGSPAEAQRAGHMAALAALQDLGRMEPAAAPPMAPMREGTEAATDALIAAIPPDCVVCRCEGVTRDDIEGAARAGARDINQLKQFTRCGMGPCQGRMCAEVAACLLAPFVGGREAVGCLTPRIPLRPVPMPALLGDFAYDDIPIPAAAPI